MKRWSISLGTWLGTEVRIHLTFLLLLAFFGWQAAQYGGAAAAVDMTLLIVAVFTCVLLHEFGHVLAAKRFGIRTPDITLLPIGGLARLERMPRDPVQELIVALAGPAVNVAIVILLFVWRGFALSSPDELGLMRGSFSGRLMIWNVFMVAFNMIPAFPMDGGRVLRALLAMFLDYVKATRIAAVIGQAFAILGAMFALMNFGSNPLLLIIAIFIFMSAGNEAAQVSDQEAMRGLLVRQAMVTEFRSLPHTAVLRDAVQVLLAGTQHDFPVLDEAHAFKGILSRTRLISALADHGDLHPVGAVTEACDILLTPDQPLLDALEKLRLSGCPALPVLDPATQELLGLLTAENIGEMIMVRAALSR